MGLGHSRLSHIHQGLEELGWTKLANKEEPRPHHVPLFVSLGSYELQAISYMQTEIKNDIFGGGGLWATFGARLFSYGDKSKDVGCLFIAGTGFPPALYAVLASWGLTMVSRHTQDAVCTKARIQYVLDDGFRKRYTYLTPPLQAQASDLDFTVLLTARSFHILGTPQDLRQKVETITELRAKHGIQGRPKIIWEPAFIADQTTLNFEEHLAACALVDVFSPNFHELGFCIGPNMQPNRLWIMDHARHFRGMIGPLGDGVLIVRCGQFGCYWVANAFEDFQVIDQTGAGSAFLGAYMMATMKGENVFDSCLYGSIAASFAIEQFGLPKFARQKKAPRSPYRPLVSKEAWNEDDPANRLRMFRAILGEERG
ncbi:Ribokinase-like protein [Nemania sp. FL0031]|nr:Ribokinase-like protein [Nemania sp. FL0031]